MVAGIFYPDDAGTLAARVNTALAGCTLPNGSSIASRPLAILSPHAAFDYSCDVQATAWASVAQAKIDRIVIIAPLLRPQEHGAYLPESDIFQTPLGDIDVDSGAIADLESCNTLFTVNDTPHFESHAIEVQLPFMKTLFPEALLVPILVSGDTVVASNLARAIDMVFGNDMDRTLLVASSNLATSNIKAEAAQRTQEILDLLGTGDWRGLCSLKNLVGAATLASVMATQVLQKTGFKLMRHDDSHKQMESSTECIVHYVAAAWYTGE